VLVLLLYVEYQQKCFENFEIFARKFYPRRSELPVLTAITLLVPGYVNEYEVSRIDESVSKIDRTMPYSLLVFHPDFMMDDLPITSFEQNARCYKIVKTYLEKV